MDVTNCTNQSVTDQTDWNIAHDFAVDQARGFLTALKTPGIPSDASQRMANDLLWYLREAHLMPEEVGSSVNELSALGVETEQFLN